MRTTLTYTVALVIAVAMLWSAGVSASECANQPVSAGPVPAELIAACGPADIGDPPVLDPTDMAFGADGVLSACSTLVLNNPVATSPFGFLDFRPACDFVGGDFSTLYCADFNVPGNLYAVNTATCEETFIGTMATVQSASGMAWDHTTGTMFLSTTDTGTSQLFTLDVGTAAVGFIGTLTDSPANISIAVTRGGDMFGHDIVTDALHFIDKSSAFSFLIGPVGFDANFAQGFDCDDSDDTCYLFAFNNGAFLSELYTVDLSTGAGTLVGQIGDGFQEWTGAGIMAISSGPNVGGSVTGVNPRIANCRNITTGQTVTIQLMGADTWDCEANGLVVNPGDRILQRVLGIAP